MAATCIATRAPASITTAEPYQVAAEPCQIATERIQLIAAGLWRRDRRGEPRG